MPHWLRSFLKDIKCTVDDLEVMDSNHIGSNLESIVLRSKSYLKQKYICIQNKAFNSFPTFILMQTDGCPLIFVMDFYIITFSDRCQGICHQNELFIRMCYVWSMSHDKPLEIEY